MKIEIRSPDTKSLWKKARYDWRFWAATTAIATALLLIRCMRSGCRHCRPRHDRPEEA